MPGQRPRRASLMPASPGFRPDLSESSWRSQRVSSCGERPGPWADAVASLTKPETGSIGTGRNARPRVPGGRTGRWRRHPGIVGSSTEPGADPPGPGEREGGRRTRRRQSPCRRAALMGQCASRARQVCSQVADHPYVGGPRSPRRPLPAPGCVGVPGGYAGPDQDRLSAHGRSPGFRPRRADCARSRRAHPSATCPGSPAWSWSGLPGTMPRPRRRGQEG